MPQPFSRTLRALERESRAGSLAFRLLFAAIGCGWCGWFFGARLSVLAVADGKNARIEVSRHAHPVQAGVSGRVVAIQSGREFEQGALIVELDTSAQLNLREQKRIEQRGLTQQLAALHEQIAALSRLQRLEHDANELRANEAEVRREQAAASAQFRTLEAARDTQLQRLGARSAADALRGTNAAVEQQNELRALAVASARTRADQGVLAAERQRELVQLQREASELEERLALVVAALRDVERELARRRITAPVRGRLSDNLALTVGSWVHEGELLALLIPPGGLHIVAYFAPEAAIGRLHPGQLASMRVTGFPWAHYGMLHGRVTNVASELEDGRVRVELELPVDETSAIPLQHGLPGSVEIVVERVSPAKLVWRAAGQRLRSAPATGAT